MDFVQGVLGKLRAGVPILVGDECSLDDWKGQGNTQSNPACRTFRWQIQLKKCPNFTPLDNLNLAFLWSSLKINGVFPRFGSEALFDVYQFTIFTSHIALHCFEYFKSNLSE